MVGLLAHAIETGDTMIIFAGAVWAFARFASTGIRRRSLIGEFNKIDLNPGWFFILGLQFQLAGDVLRTAVAPGFAEIGRDRKDPAKACLQPDGDADFGPQRG
ncbi:DUF1622 domain-containing protein [Streptomyces goshikiensis]|uniref:DUF1622 domain-containing protein n=1 Tax=Streptomyces goshikiensis TaxID=1942 RepID=UPI0036B719AE